VDGNPINFADPGGLFWPINSLKCLYYGKKITKLRKECEKEKGDSCEDTLNFIQKYGGGFEGSAIWNCIMSKDPNLFNKWVIACFKFGFLGSPKPKPTSP